MVELPHPGGHQIYPAVLPEIRRIIADVTMPTTRVLNEAGSIPLRVTTARTSSTPACPSRT